MILRTLAGKFRPLLAVLAFPLLLAAQAAQTAPRQDVPAQPAIQQVSPKQVSPQQLKPTGYVNDFAEIFNVSTTEKLNALCKEIDLKAKAQIAVVTVESLGDADIESFTADLFKRWGVGGKSSNRGVLILMSVQERAYRIEVGYGLEPILPDGKVGSFGREAVPLLRQGDYGGAAQLMTWRVAETISADAKVTLEQTAPSDLDLKPQPAPATEPPSSDSIPTGVVITVVVVFLIILGIAFAIGGWGGVFNVFFFILNIIFSSGSSSSSSSGFGGGGGFGGFGGGSSGGGGASGSW
jgi:uncharacterized protein